MVQRIQELAETATSPEQLAEMVVEECGRFLADWCVDPVHIKTDFDRGVHWAYSTAGQLLKQHWGISDEENS